MDIASGAFRVKTLSSNYEIDLDRMVVRRGAASGAPGGSLLRRDGEEVRLLGIEDCTVGRSRFCESMSMCRAFTPQSGNRPKLSPLNLYVRRLEPRH